MQKYQTLKRKDELHISTIYGHYIYSHIYWKWLWFSVLTSPTHTCVNKIIYCNISLWEFKHYTYHRAQSILVTQATVFQHISVYDWTQSNLVGQIYCTLSMRESLTICNNVIIHQVLISIPMCGRIKESRWMITKISPSDNSRKVA